MRILKKSLACCLAAIIALTVMCGCIVSADTINGTITAEAVTAVEGANTVTVPVTVTNASPVAITRLVVSSDIGTITDAVIDTEKSEGVKAIEDTLENPSTNFEDGVILIEANDWSIGYTTATVNVTFTASAALAAGAEYDVTVSGIASIEGADWNENGVIYTYVPGKITVEAAAPEGPVRDESLATAIQNQRILIDSAFGFYYELYIPKTVPEMGLEGIDYDDFELRITKPELNNRFQYTGKTVTTVLTSADTVGSSGLDAYGFFYLNYADISLYEMSLDINTSLHLFKDGKEFAYYDYGTKTLTAVANDYYEANKADDVKRQFAVSFLNLGTKAQEHFAAAGADDNALKDFALPNADIPDITDVPEYGNLDVLDGTLAAGLYDIQMLFEKAPSLYYTVYLASTDITDYTVNITYTSKNAKAGDNGVISYSAKFSDLIGTNNNSAQMLALGMAYVAFDKVTLYDANKVVTLTVVDTEGNVVATQEYNVLTRLATQLEDTGTVGDLYRATAVFGAAAKAFWPDFY